MRNGDLNSHNERYKKKIKFNNHKNLLKEYKQLEFIEREVGVSFMSTEEYTRLNMLKNQLGK